MQFDPITTEVLRSNFESIAEEMGAALIRTAYSTNIRDRRDCSCAVFDNKGRCLAQATHLPIHLGALVWSVQQSLRVFPVEKLEPGDAIITNDPFMGNSHMPDITIFAPVFYEEKCIGIVANMAHHVDIGGSNPGSSTANATELFQEGLRIPPSKIRKHGKMDEEILNIMDANSRTPETNRGDTMAQIAANNTAEKRLLELAYAYGPQELLSFGEELMNSTERRMRKNLSDLVPDGTYEFEDYVEGDGIDDHLIKIRVSIQIKGSEAIVDFTGTDKQAKGPISCVYGLTKSCVNFVMKAVIDPYCPTNEGAYRPFHLIAPPGTMVNALYPAATNSSLNVTSQKIAETLIGALSKAIPERVHAGGPGCIFTVYLGGWDPFRKKSQVYIEAFGGGQGAKFNQDGYSAITVDMTNSKNMPIEAAEIEHPIFIESYSLREESEGPGKYRGGFGLRRVIIPLCPLTLTVHSDRRKVRPWGLNGGYEGEGATFELIGTDGKMREMPTKITLEVKPKEKIIVSTAGGGGWGDPKERDPKEVEEDLRSGLITISRTEEIYRIK